MGSTLERTYFKKINSNPKIGIFCDVTVHRISLFWACFENIRQNVNLSVTQPSLNNKNPILCEFSVGIEAKNDPLNILIFCLN